MREIKLVLCVILLWLFYFSIKYQDFIFINVKEMFVYFTPKPMVSVVIASYHMGKVLPEAINSIIEQSYKDWEVVVIDDGSLDNTQKILRQYRFNRKIRV